MNVCRCIECVCTVSKRGNYMNFCRCIKHVCTVSKEGVKRMSAVVLSLSERSLREEITWMSAVVLSLSVRSVREEITWISAVVLSLSAHTRFEREEITWMRLSKKFLFVSLFGFKQKLIMCNIYLFLSLTNYLWKYYCSSGTNFVVFVSLVEISHSFVWYTCSRIKESLNREFVFTKIIDTHEYKYLYRSLKSDSV